MKSYPSIGRGLQVVFYAELIGLFLTGYSIVRYFFPTAEAILIPVQVLNALACCGLTAGAALCVREDKKYLPALAAATGTVVLSIAVLFFPYPATRIFLNVLQAAGLWLLLYSLSSRSAALLQDRDRDCARGSGRAIIVYLIPCGVRYLMPLRGAEGAALEALQSDATPYFGWNLGQALFLLALVLYASSYLLRFLRDAAAMLSYGTAPKA